jgi:hypothetical protein
MVFREHLENVEIVLCYDDPRYNVVLPVERPQQKIEGASSDRAGEPLVPGKESSDERGKEKPSL